MEKWVEMRGVCFGITFLVGIFLFTCAPRKDEKPPAPDKGVTAEKNSHTADQGVDNESTTTRTIPPKVVTPQPPLNLKPDVIPTRVVETPVYKPITSFDEIIEFQKREVAKASGTEKEERERHKLFILYILAERFIDAESLLQGFKTQESAEFIYINSAYLYNILGEHKLARERLKAILERWEKPEGIYVEKIELCEFVEGFRRYKKYTGGNKFKPGATLLIYIEPKNFTLKKAGNNFIMHLNYDWELVDEKDKSIEITKWKDAPARDKTDVLEFHDDVKEFFQTFRLPLPQNLPIGRYKLKFILKDVNADKSATAYTDIEIVDLP
jgi:hypothetical protein